MTTNATTNAPRPVRPIGRVRLGTPMLLGIVVAISVPVTVAYGAAGGFSHFHDRELNAPVALTGPIVAVEVTGLDGDVQITGDPEARGVTGTSTVDYHEIASRPQTRTTVVDGVARLDFTCPDGGCDGGVIWHLTVPAGVPVTAVTSNATVNLESLSGPVKGTSSNGDIDAKHLGSGDATFRTSNAGVSLQFDGAPHQVAVTTSNAGVDVQTDGKTPAYDQVQTTNGSMEFSNPGCNDRSVERTIAVTTTNGGVSIH